MALDDALRQRGFRRWYERQLIESHVYLVTGFLSLIMMAVALEVTEFRSSAANFAFLVAVALAGALVCIGSWRKFTEILFRAEAVAEQAVCPMCGTYGRFDVVSARDATDAVTGRIVDVRCRTCAHEWPIG
jgi:formate dehydrogenase maturation protein FdhE